VSKSLQVENSGGHSPQGLFHSNLGPAWADGQMIAEGLSKLRFAAAWLPAHCGLRGREEAVKTIPPHDLTVSTRA